MEKKISQAIQDLSARGLNLLAILNPSRFPPSLKQLLIEAGISILPSHRLVLIGHAGKKLWQKMQQQQLFSSDTTDPIDEYSIQGAKVFANRIVGPDNYQLLYPGDAPVPLQQLGQLAGWHHPTPIGIGILPDWGTWFAYRALLLIDVPLPEITRRFDDTTPCDHCTEKPCVSHCPANATQAESHKSFEACCSYRLQPDSACAETCLARVSCPVGSDHRYSTEQLNYHYRLSLQTLQEYFGN